MDLKDYKNYLNRDLSWIEFNRRVLAEALDISLPLLERIKFISIFCTNLDEFYMIRVSGLVEQLKLNNNEKSIDGLSSFETLKKIENNIRPLIVTMMNCFQTDLIPKLYDEGIKIYDYENLDEKEIECLNLYFDNEIFPVLTPLAFDPGRPFPLISNLSINLAVLLEHPNENERHFARVKVPKNLSRIVNINKILKKYNFQSSDNNKTKLIFLEHIIKANIKKLFPFMEILDTFTFRVTRDTDIEIQEDEADDLLTTIEENIKQRRFGAVVRLEIEEEIPYDIKDLLSKNLEMDENLVHIVNGPVGLGDLIALYELPYSKLKTKSFSPSIPKIFDTDTNIFSVIRKNDIILHHPYHSFTPVIDFIKQASVDPAVLAIKQTLYRVGSNSPIIESLIEASENGKQVAVLVELKARFDEENNILWARRLEKVGVHVVYGLVGLKTHCKMALVVRKEDDELRRYVHLGTGNYNTTTSKSYTDIGLLTCDNDICSDVSEVFNFLTGYSNQKDFKELLVAPINLRKKLIELINKEINSHKLNGNGHIIMKMNSLTDPEIIQELYLASLTGVKIDLIVRGVCMLRPNVNGLSENIRVISLVGRFLEHARIFYFKNNTDPIIILGSADMMERNLNRRVELLFPIKQKHLKNYIFNNILSSQLKDNVNSSLLMENGNYIQNVSDSKELFNTHFLQLTESNSDTPWSAKSNLKGIK